MRRREIVCGSVFNRSAGSKKLINRLVTERNEGGAFESFADFHQRLKPPLRQMRVLIKAGCFDSVAGQSTRPGLLWLAHALDSGRAAAGLPNPEDYPPERKLGDEIECFGFPLSSHPLDLYSEQARQIDFIPANTIEKYVGRRIRVLGWLINEKLTQTTNGDPMEFVTFEDTSAIYEATFFPDVYRRLWRKLVPNRPFIIDGFVEEEFGAVTVNVKGLEYLDVMKRRCYRKSSETSYGKTEAFGRRFPSAETNVG